eukprot:7227869-Pyramimonas_sp.AAC.1
MKYSSHRCDQSDAGSAGTFSRRTNQTQEARVYSHRAVLFDGGGALSAVHDKELPPLFSLRDDGLPAAVLDGSDGVDDAKYGSLV